MFRIIRKDIEAYQKRIGGTRMRQWLEVFRAPGIHAVIVYRFGRWLLERSLPIRILLEPLYVLLWQRIRARWGIEIVRSTQIGEGFVVQHLGSVIIGGPTTIGKNFIVHQDVTIGRIFQGRYQGLPEIGDNVTIAPGAKLFGKITIGNNVKIGPNAVILKRNIPDNAVVTVSESQVVVMNSSDNEASKAISTFPLI
jgi:serine O-acetyltransferase